MLSILVLAAPAHSEFRGPYCFSPPDPHRLHGPYEPKPKWDWDNRQQS